MREEGGLGRTWDPFWKKQKASGRPSAMANAAVFREAAAFLNRPEILRVEDWGCGHRAFREYLGAHQEYIGVDGSSESEASRIVDLTQYVSRDGDGLFMRGVLEHNQAWGDILWNVLASSWQTGRPCLLVALRRGA